MLGGLGVWARVPTHVGKQIPKRDDCCLEVAGATQVAMAVCLFWGAGEGNINKQKGWDRCGRRGGGWSGDARWHFRTMEGF